jgi:hypothetical protein
MRGGKRAGAGRPPLDGGAVRKTIVLSEDDLTFLRSLSPNLSRAVRLLIAQYAGDTPPNPATDRNTNGVP